MDLANIQELAYPTAEELTEYDLMEMSGAEPELDDEEEDIEEAVPENKLTSDNLAEGFRLLKPRFNFLHHELFYDTGTETEANGGRSVSIILEK